MAIGLVGALNEEINLFLSEMDVEQVQDHAEIRFFEGKLAGQQVVVCKSGVGKVNAALATQILIDLFQVELVVFSGIAGALHTELKVGDIEIPFVVVRGISDRADRGAPKDFAKFVKIAAHRAQVLVLAMLELFAETE